VPDPAALPELEPEPDMLPEAPLSEPEAEPAEEPLPELEPDMLPDALPRSESVTDPAAEPLPEPEAEPDALQPARAIMASASVVANNFLPSIPCTSLHRYFGRAGPVPSMWVNAPNALIKCRDRQSHGVIESAAETGLDATMNLPPRARAFKME